jgi:Ca2+-binding RTX toxin-like protein
MTMLLKRLGGETTANSFTAATDSTEYFIGHEFYLTQGVSRLASLVSPLAPGEGGAAHASVVVSSVSSFEASNASDLQGGEKAVPFGLPCITDEKLLMLMAQDSVSGRIAALHATDSPVDSSIDDEPATVPIAVGASVTGVIDVTGDMDDISVTLVAGQRYMISLMGTGASALRDSYLEIFNPSLVSVGHDDDGGVGTNSVMTITAAVSGTYTIRASAFANSGTGQYTVDVRQMGTDSIPATIGGAVPIGQGITFGFRETDSDSDYYKISLVAGQSYSFSVAAGTDHETSFNPIPAGEFDTILVLRGPTGAILTSNDDISWPSDASSSFQFQATSTGDYYLEVTAYTHTAAPGGNTGGYVIDFHEVPPPDPLDSLDWGTAANIPTVMVGGVPTAYVYFAVAGENFGENARAGDPTQPASGGNGTLVSYGWTAYEKAQFMLAMQEYARILGIAYVETANSAQATFRVITNSSNAYGAYAYPQDPAYGTQKGIMVFNVDNRGWDLDSADPAVTTDGLGRGGYAWTTILHEAGHAHGLAHPHDTGGGSEVMVGVTSPDSLGVFDLNQQVYTQMSYNGGWQTHPDGSLTNGDPTGWRSDAGWLATMGAFDVAVLQARYGVTPAFATGDNVYTLLDVNAEGTYFETIYDTGGIDTIVYNGARGAQIDLNTATLDYSVTGGGIVSFVRNLPGQTAAQAIKGGFTIANGVVIENATGGSGDDVLIGNEAANVLTGNGGNDVFMGGGGADLLDGGAGADSMAGGAGNDLYFVDNSSDSVTEAAGEGTDEVRTALAVYVLAANVETLTGTSATGQVLTGNAANNLVNAGSGDDVLHLWVGGGNDIVNAGAGLDNIFFGATLTAADVVNGGAGVDTLVVQGPYGSLTLTANITQIENVSILGGNNINFGEPGTNRYDYVLTTNNANFAAGVQARINGSALLVDEDFTFDGSAETDASFVVYGGKGKDTLLGGFGNDIFIYPEERFQPGDTVNGGPGGYDGIFFRGNYTIDFNAPGYFGLMTGIENMTLTSATDERYARGGGTEFDYNITLADNMLLPGVELTVSGALLMATETMILDGSLEMDGTFRLFGGKAADTLKGGAKNDLIHGNQGADTLSGGGGADAFRYQNVLESNGPSRDHILDFTPGTDKIELDRIDANTLAGGNQAFTWIGSNAFSNSAGELRAFQSGGIWIVEGDINGDGFADLVIALTLQGPTPLGAGDFLL